ncbi:GNAT family N-acetyltransferase [Spirochaeta lutea]|uniref:Acetyltransferase n=1 Tax=Spirochaeta lutea TaxID=1480694 RepID=A0A098QWL7_9SPIO|nr:N-acetyltransferase [Spirochaeta lutea]KGE70847.1 acetyltransferase [Spirochaeta lutea]
MEFGYLESGWKHKIRALFEGVFTDSEGAAEGRLIGELAGALADRIDNRGVLCFGAREGDAVVGAIFFTALEFEQSPDTGVYMLAPVAVSTSSQGRGIGTRLITFGLDDLTNRGADLAITYGDPAYYSRVGFRRIPEDTIQAPLELSMPEGWLGQSLKGERIPVLPGRPRCVEAFNNPAYW